MHKPDRLVKLGLFGVIAAGLALAVRGLAALWTGSKRGWAVMERKG